MLNIKELWVMTFWKKNFFYFFLLKHHLHTSIFKSHIFLGWYLFSNKKNEPPCWLNSSLAVAVTHRNQDTSVISKTWPWSSDPATWPCANLSSSQHATVSLRRSGGCFLLLLLSAQPGDDKAVFCWGRSDWDGAKNFSRFFFPVFPSSCLGLKLLIFLWMNTAGLLRSNWRCWIKYVWKMCKVNIRGIWGFCCFWCCCCGLGLGVCCKGGNKTHGWIFQFLASFTIDESCKKCILCWMHWHDLSLIGE